MSTNAARDVDPDGSSDGTSNSKGLTLVPRREQTDLSKSLHHVPPRHAAANTPFKLKKTVIDHRAYHQLFRNAGSFEQCCEILLREWWTKPALQEGEEP